MPRYQWIQAGWSGFDRESTDNVIDNRGLGSRLQQILLREAHIGLVSAGNVIGGGLVAVSSWWAYPVLCRKLPCYQPATQMLAPRW